MQHIYEIIENCSEKHCKLNIVSVPAKPEHTCFGEAPELGACCNATSKLRRSSKALELVAALQQAPKLSGAWSLLSFGARSLLQ